MARTGRPSGFTTAKAKCICRLVTEGESIRMIGKRKDMPTAWTIFEWLRRHPDFSSQYMRAKEEGMENEVAEIRSIADDIPDNATHEDIAKARLQIDARKWRASKLAPKKYGDRIEHVGPDGGPILITEVCHDMGGGDEAE